MKHTLIATNDSLVKEGGDWLLNLDLERKQKVSFEFTTSGHYLISKFNNL